jgi:hypothetical protein
MYVKVWPFHTFNLYELSYYINLKPYTIKLMEFINIQIHHYEIKKGMCLARDKENLYFFGNQNSLCH